MSSKAIPQPQETFLIGNLKEIDPDRFGESLQRLQELYGEIYRLTFLKKNLIVLSSQELINFVCDESKFEKKIAASLVELRNAGGDGLFTAHTSEPNWKLAHKILMPAFGPQTIREMFPAMMDIASQLILRWERFPGEEIDVCDNLTRLTLDTIALCSFNYRFNSFYHSKMHRFVEAMINVLLESGRRSQRFALQNTLMVTTSRWYYNEIAYLHNLCDEIVKERREKPNDVKDLLNRMIHGRDPDTGYQLSDENIRFQMLTFLVAGHETTSGLLSFAIYYLLKNPQTLQKAQAEVDQVGDIKMETLNQLKYIDAILKETLRLQPTAPGFVLQAKEAHTVLPGGYEIQKDDSIVVLLHKLHRDPKVWDRPEEFLPERMLNGGYENLPPNAWKPFGNGQRACIGRPFAWQESLLTIALILKHFNLELVDPSYNLRIKQTLTIKPEGFKIRVRSRQQVEIALGRTMKELTKPIVEKPSETKNLRPMTVLFGSNSGSCQSFAETLASEAPLYGYNATVTTLDSAVGSLPTDQPVIIITASYEGKPCENAKQFVAYLESKPTLSIDYAVFGAGHHDWVKTYQQIPTTIDRLLETCGSRRLVERGEGDAGGDFYGAFESWKENLFEILRKDIGEENVVSEEKLSIEIVNSKRNFGQIKTDVGIVLENKVLVPANGLVPTIKHLEVKLPKGQTYHTGDYLAILPSNPMEIVYRVLKRFNLSTDTQVRILSSTSTFFPTNNPISAFDILSGYVELSQPISKKQLEILATFCQQEQEQQGLRRLLSENLYEAEVLNKRISILDMLELYPSCQLSFAQYLRMLPSLRVRQYSISSSPLWNSEVVTLTFDVLNTPALSGSGAYLGVASNYLGNLREGDRISCAVRASNAQFHPPEDTKIPMVLIAAGTGIAPFRGFIQERAAQFVCGRKVGPTVLYYGCRSEEDNLYFEELNQWSKLGAVKLRIVFSRQPNSEGKKYVQDLLWEDREEIQALYQDGARFYTCGSARKVGASVKACFIQIIRDMKQCTEEQATTMLEEMSQDRYSVDVFT